MAGFFFNLGRTVGSGLRQGKWIFHSFTGTEEDALLAEFELGRDLAAQFLLQTPAASSPESVALLAEVGLRLVARVKDRRRQFRFHIVQAPDVNAFALPAGFVFLTRPLWAFC